MLHKYYCLTELSVILLSSQLLGSLRKEDHKFEVSLENLVRPYFKIKKRKKLKRAGEVAQGLITSLFNP